METFYFPLAIVSVAAVVVDTDEHGEETAEDEIGIVGCDSGAPVHRSYGAQLHFHRGERLPLSVAVVAAWDTGAD